MVWDRWEKLQILWPYVTFMACDEISVVNCFHFPVLDFEAFGMFVSISVVPPINIFGAYWLPNSRFAAVSEWPSIR
jgi:hypothetical protein